MNVREFLKQGTSEDHAQIEKLLNLVSDQVTIESYRKQLEFFYGFYSAIEKKISEIKNLPQGLDWDLRKKARHLYDDLISLDADPTSNKQYKLPTMNSLAQVLGVLYVLEGSTLGGQMISKHITNLLSLTPQNGLAFFSGYQSKTPDMWRKFIAVLEENVVTDEEKIAALESARETFQCMNMN